MAVHATGYRTTNMKSVVLEPAVGASTEVIEVQTTRTTSTSLDVIEMHAVEEFSELRESSAFDFWHAKEEDGYDSPTLSR